LNSTNNNKSNTDTAYLGIELKWEGEGVNEKGIIDSIDEEQYETATSQHLNSSTPQQKNASTIQR
jgi:GDPmannose 4,6-dehydratase